MNREEIMQILPHRDNMLLIETAEMGEDGVATATYTVRGDEFFLQGHFPGNPVVPGVILCEIIAQGACTLFGEEMKGKTPLYTGIDKVRFRRMVKPGDAITVKASLLRHKMNLYVISGEAWVDGQKAVSGEFSFALVDAQ